MSNVKAFTKPKRQAPCARCGIKAETGKYAKLCRDCRGVLTKDEVKLWAA